MRKYAAAFIAGLTITVLYLLSKNIRNADGTAEVFRLLSDGCFSAGVILAGCGALSGIAGEGFFTIFSYGIKSFFMVFHRDPSKRRMSKSFLEYRNEVEEQKKKFVYLILTGAVYLVLAFVFYLLFEQYSK